MRKILLDLLLVPFSVSASNVYSNMAKFSIYPGILLLVFALFTPPQMAFGQGTCDQVFQHSETFDSLSIAEIAYRLNHVFSERRSVDDVRSTIKNDPEFLRESLELFESSWKKSQKPVLSTPTLAVKKLVKIGFSPVVAERIVTYDPALAVEILERSQSKPIRVLKVYRGVSVAPKAWDPTQGEWAQIGDYTYAMGFAVGSEGRGTHMANELKDLRHEGHQHWGVLVEMEVPDFLYTSDKSTGRIRVSNQAVVASRIGTFFIGSKGKPKFLWLDVSEFKKVLDIDQVYLLREGIEMIRR